MDRSKGLGGTDIGCIIGVNPWRGPIDVYLEKIGITEGQPDNENMFWGREMEPVLAKRYQREMAQIELFIPSPDQLPFQHPIYPWYLGSPDATADRGKGGVDFKTTGNRNGWGEPGTDEVPEWIHTQADWYMGLTGAGWWDIAVLFFSPRREFAIYRIPRNQELIDNLIEAGREFWENHVVTQIPPPIDDSEGSKKLLNYLYPQDKEDLLQSIPEIEKIAEILKRQEENRDLIIKDLTYTQNLLKEIIGSHAGVQTSLGKITWKKSKDREQVDWKAVADHLLKEIGTTFEKWDINNEFTKTIPGSRIFRTYFKREE